VSFFIDHNDIGQFKTHVYNFDKNDVTEKKIKNCYLFITIL